MDVLYYAMLVILFFFFFQAEDGIRDHCVTGVQTCALPISRRSGVRGAAPGGARACRGAGAEVRVAGRGRSTGARGRSEERRVGKECRSRGSPDHEKKKDKKNR